MAFDGSGVFLRLRSWIADATAGVKVRADFHDDEDNNFADGLSHCITKDGQTTITQNIPWNSKRITALQDPVDAQDAATKHYADTKMPLDGSAPITGDVIIRNDDPSLTLDGKPGFNNTIFGDKNSKHRWALILGNAVAETGSNAGSDFQLIKYADDGTTASGVLYGYRSTGLMIAAADPTVPMGIATKQYADTKLPLTGGTISGNLATTGWLMAQNGVVYLNASANRFLQWTSDYYNLGGASTLYVGGYTVWHSGNFTPGAGAITSLQLIFAGSHNHTSEGQSDPFAGGLACGFGFPAAFPDRTLIVRYRYLQAYVGGYWYTVAYAD